MFRYSVWFNDFSLKSCSCSSAWTSNKAANESVHYRIRTESTCRRIEPSDILPTRFRAVSCPTQLCVSVDAHVEWDSASVGVEYLVESAGRIVAREFIEVPIGSELIREQVIP